MYQGDNVTVKRMDNVVMVAENRDAAIASDHRTAPVHSLGYLHVKFTALSAYIDETKTGTVFKLILRARLDKGNHS
jgi:hypothetical protein